MEMGKEGGKMGEEKKEKRVKQEQKKIERKRSVWWKGPTE